MSSSNVMANGHHNKSHNSGVISPFDDEQKGISAHCLFNNHKHNYNFCPHSSKPAPDGEQRLSANCGGKPLGTLPSVSLHKDNIDNSSFISGLNNVSVLLSATLSLASQEALNLQDPPPKIH